MIKSTVAAVNTLSCVHSGWKIRTFHEMSCTWWVTLKNINWLLATFIWHEVFGNEMHCI